MKNNWQLQEAKDQLSTVVESALTRGPQTITRHGVPAVVVVAVKDYRRETARKKSLLALFDPVRGLDIDVPRDKSRSRKVTL